MSQRTEGIDRRQLLGLLRAGAVTAAAWPLLRPPRAGAAAASPPRFYLQIIPQGGMDAIYSTDPKKPSEVERGIDVPFPARDIVEAGGVRLGPGFRKLARWMPRLAIVNAFRQSSANHLSGLAHVMRCKSHTTTSMPSLLEILGSRRQGQATAAINIGAVMNSAFSPRFLGAPGEMTFGTRPGLFEHLDQADPEDLAEAAKALRREAALVSGPRASAAERVTADNLLESAELLARVAASPKFAPVEWAHDMEGQYRNGRDLQRVLWLFENQLTRCVTVCVGAQDYDTHLWNTLMQPLLTEYLASLLDRLFGELDRRTVGGALLSRQTLVIVGSEIGRFPRLNSSQGKDHFPQVPHLFFGPGLATGATYGTTGRDMASLPVSLATGRPDPAGHLLRIDDLGTTLLALDGANPELYGYAGERLRFLTGG
jgi:uncharacterized protein (DUF1501 family)